MKLTKFVHSCVLIEDDGKTVLFDPGIFSWNSGFVDINKLPLLNTIVVTHKHADHFGEPFVRALITKFPGANWLVPSDLIEELRSFGASSVSDKSSEYIDITVGEHAHVVPFGVQVQNLSVNWNNKVTNPGDSHEASGTKDLLLLPVQAPWGTTVRAVELALELKPRYVLPIHDWMWNEQWRQVCYDRFDTIFSEAGIKLLRPVDGVSLEIEI